MFKHPCQESDAVIIGRPFLISRYGRERIPGWDESFVGVFDEFRRIATKHGIESPVRRLPVVYQAQAEYQNISDRSGGLPAGWKELYY